MSTKVLSKHLAGNSKFSLPNNPVSNYWATLYSCAGHALHKGAVIHNLAFAHLRVDIYYNSFPAGGSRVSRFNDITRTNFQHGSKMS